MRLLVPRAHYRGIELEWTLRALRALAERLEAPLKAREGLGDDRGIENGAHLSF